MLYLIYLSCLYGLCQLIFQGAWFLCVVSLRGCDESRCLDRIHGPGKEHRLRMTRDQVRTTVLGDVYGRL